MSGAKHVPAIPSEGIGSLADLLKKQLEPEDPHVTRAREDFDYFLENVIRDPKGNFIELQEFHHRFTNILVNRRRSLTFLPRGFGKSTIACAYATWKVGQNHDTRVFIASKGSDLAEERMRIIEHILSSKEYIAVFGNLIPPARTQVWTVDEKVVAGRSPHATHSTFYAVGIGGQAAGRRADIVLCDDVIDEKNAVTEIQRGHASRWFWKEVEPVLEPGTGQWIVIATPWSHNDLYAEIQAAWGDDEELDFEFLKVQAIKEIEDKETGNTVWVSVWPQRFTTHELLKKRQVQPLYFTSQYMCEPIDTTHSFLKKEWLRITEEGEDGLPVYEDQPDNLVIYFGVDPTWSGRKQADQFALAVLGVDPKTRKGWVLDIMHAQLSPSEAMTMVHDAALFWKPILVNFESNAAQTFLAEQYIENTSLPINPVKVSGPKEERFKAMSVHFTSGRFGLAGYRAEDGELRPKPSLDSLLYEWVTFPHGDHDDVLDAVEKALMAAAYGSEPVESGLSEYEITVRRAQMLAEAPPKEEICDACGKADIKLIPVERWGLCATCYITRSRNTQGMGYNAIKSGRGVPFHGYQ